MTTTQAHTQAGAFGAGVRTSGRFGREMAYLLSGLPLGIAAFTLIVTGLSAGVSLLVVVIGLPVLAGTLAVARWFGAVEAEWIAAATGRPLPLSRGAGPGATGTWGLLRDPQAWRDLVHTLLAFPLRITTAACALAWPVGGLGGVTYGLWSWAVPRDENDGLMDLAFGITGSGADITFNTVVGVLLLATTVPVVRGLTAVQAGLGRLLLRAADR